MSQPCIHIEVSVYTAVDTGVDVEEFVVTVRYCGRDVLTRSVSSRAGCRLCYDESDIAQPLDDDIGHMVNTVHNYLAHITSSQFLFSLTPSVTHSAFHSRLKTHLFHKSFMP